MLLAASAGCGRAGYDPGTCGNLSSGRPATAIGMTFSGSSPGEAVDNAVGQTQGYWACMNTCSLVVDLEQTVRVDRIDVWPGGNSLPTAYYLQRSWRVVYAHADDSDTWLDFSQVVVDSGVGTLGPGLRIAEGWPPQHANDSTVRHQEYEFYRFRFAPVSARFIRFESIEGDVDNDTNVDEIAVYGCAFP